MCGQLTEKRAHAHTIVCRQASEWIKTRQSKQRRGQVIQRTIGGRPSSTTLMFWWYSSISIYYYFYRNNASELSVATATMKKAEWMNPNDQFISLVGGGIVCGGGLWLPDNRFWICTPIYTVIYLLACSLKTGVGIHSKLPWMKMTKWLNRSIVTIPKTKTKRDRISAKPELETICQHLHLHPLLKHQRD